MGDAWIFEGEQVPQDTLRKEKMVYPSAEVQKANDQLQRSWISLYKEDFAKE